MISEPPAPQNSLVLETRSKARYRMVLPRRWEQYLGTLPRLELPSATVYGEVDHNFGPMDGGFTLTLAATDAVSGVDPVAELLRTRRRQPRSRTSKAVDLLRDRFIETGVYRSPQGWAWILVSVTLRGGSCSLSGTLPSRDADVFLKRASEWGRSVEYLPPSTRDGFGRAGPYASPSTYPSRGLSATGLLSENGVASHKIRLGHRQNRLDGCRLPFTDCQ